MRITEKILLLFLPTFMLSVVTMTLLSRRAAEKILIEDVAFNGRALRINLVQSREMVESFRGGDESLLQPPLQQVQANTTAQYAMVLGLEGRVLAHTDVSQKGKVYDDEASRRAVNSNVPLQSELVVGGRRVMDVSCPVWEILGAEEGEAFLRLGRADGTGARRLGTIRLGLPLDRALDTADRISKQVLWIVTVINIIAMGISLFYVRKILRPVRLMAAATERIAAGELGASVPVMSRDEMGELAHSFNRMSQELATTMVSVDFLDNILNNMRDVLVVTNADGSVRRVNRAALELLDYDEGDVIGRSASRLFSEAAGSLFSAQSVIDMAREGGVDAREADMLSSKGEPIPVLVSVAPFRDHAGVTAGFIITAADITERARAEERIRRSLEEKEVLLKEIHHRVNNNLQIISSLLNLQSSQIVDPLIKSLFSDSQNRVQSMALIHEKLYQSEDLARVDFCDYLHSLAMTLYQSYLQTSQAVTVDIDVEKGLLLGIDQAIPCGLIVNELVSNALKHAFPSGQGRVSVTFSKSHNDDEYRLVIEDDGTGLPPDIDLQRSDFLGLKLVSLLVEQLHATVSVEPAATGERPGARYTIEFQDRPGTAAPD